MTQRWPPPGLPEELPYEAPRYYEEETYYESGGGAPFQRSLPFVTGSCLTLLLCMCAFGCFVVFWTVAWFGGDVVLTQVRGEPVEPGAVSAATPSGAFADQGSPFANTPPVAAPDPNVIPPATPQPQAPGGPGASPETAARIDQPLASSNGLEITVLDVRRDLSLAEPPLEPGKGFLSVSLKLRSLRGPGETNAYDPLNFLLVDSQGNSFAPDPVADNGRRLVAGEMTGGSIIDGDLIFQAPETETSFFLLWDTGAAEDVLWYNLQP